MGIFIGKHNRRSTSWIGRFDPTDQQDMREYDIVKSIVKIVNSNSKEKFRVEKKGGMKNATLWDVYIWKRHDYKRPNGLSWGESVYPDPTWSEYS